MRSEKTRKFNGKTYRVSDLKEGPYKKKLVKGLMSARRDVGTALKKKKTIKKVIKGLNKASKLHAGQAKALKGVIGAKKKRS